MMDSGMTITVNFIEGTELVIHNVIREEKSDNGASYCVTNSEGKKYIVPFRNVAYIEINDPDTIII